MTAALEHPATARSLRANAVRVGLRRGWTEFLLSLRSSQDQWFYLFTAFLVLGYLWLRRDTAVEGTDLSFATVTLPSLLAALVVFGYVIGPAYTLAMEKEDGTLLRARATPYGMTGYYSGHLLATTLGLLPQLTVVLVPAFLIFEDLMADPSGWFTVAWVLLLGMAAVLPIGIAVGALVPNVQKVGLYGMQPVLILFGISGVFFPLQALWGWVQVVAQVFPLYWLGLGMRSAFLPDSAASLEVGDSWRTAETLLVLGGWAVAGALLTPVLLRRVARRQSGAAVDAAREASAQWIR